MRKNIMILTIFDEGGQQGNGSQGNSGNNSASNNGGNSNGGNSHNGGSFSYEQLDEIATSRAERASKAAVKNFAQSKGLTEQEAEEALNDYLEQKKKRQPDLSAVEKERDEARKELAQLKNSALLRDKGVRTEDLDYVLFKVGKMVDDKTDFKKAAETFLKENPRYAGGNSGYRVSTSSTQGGNDDSSGKNTSINDAIRNKVIRR